MKDNESYESLLKKATSCIKAGNFIAAKECIRKALMEDYHSPEPQNLIGILAEFSGDCVLAGKHYRAANALDPTYKPAIINLERITSINYDTEKTDPCLGDK